MSIGDYLVVDNAFNRVWNPNLVGQVFAPEHVPSYTIVRLILNETDLAKLEGTK